MTVFVVLPTYNEAENIMRLVPELMALPVGLSVVVVDDNSPDDTGQLAEELATRYPHRIFVVHRPGKLGLGTAYITGYKHAFKLGADFVLTMDADFSHPPRDIPTMVARAAQADVVIGSRYVSGGAMISFWQRRLLSRVANTIACWVLGLQARDVTAGFRLYRRAVLESVPLDRIFSSGYSFLIEMLYLVQQRGWRVAEVPITYRDRVSGQSKISQTEIFKALYTVARLAFRRVRGK